MNTPTNPITEERIAALFIHEKIAETVKDGVISVFRSEQSKTDKPYYVVHADCAPRVKGAQGAYSPKTAMRLVRYFRK